MAKRAEAGSPLTEREIEVLRIMARGKTNREIGKALGVRSNTVVNYMQRIRDRLEARNNVEILIKAARLGLLTSDGSTK